VVCVTSPDRAGQGFLAAALARAASRSGLRVAVIDADLQQPALAQILGVAPAEAGLVELLSGSASGAQAFRRDPRSRAQMIAPLRPASDAERILASARLADFLARLRKSFDIVVVNAPPLASGAGVSSLHGLSSALVVVGRAGSLGEPAYSRAIAALQKRRGAAIGLVVAG
jgi:receptor protein-tyrosine kinase